jgi:hypothetical protein
MNYDYELEAKKQIAATNAMVEKVTSLDLRTPSSPEEREARKARIAARKAAAVAANAEIEALASAAKTRRVPEVGASTGCFGWGCKGGKRIKGIKGITRRMRGGERKWGCLTSADTAKRLRYFRRMKNEESLVKLITDFYETFKSSQKVKAFSSDDIGKLTEKKVTIEKDFAAINRNMNELRRVCSVENFSLDSYEGKNILENLDTNFKIIKEHRDEYNVLMNSIRPIRQPKPNYKSAKVEPYMASNEQKEFNRLSKARLNATDVNLDFETSTAPQVNEARSEGCLGAACSIMGGRRTRSRKVGKKFSRKNMRGGNPATISDIEIINACKSKDANSGIKSACSKLEDAQKKLSAYWNRATSGNRINFASIAPDNQEYKRLYNTFLDAGAHILKLINGTNNAEQHKKGRMHED